MRSKSHIKGGQASPPGAPRRGGPVKPFEPAADTI